MPYTAMRGGLGFIPEGFGELEMAGQGRDGVVTVAVRAVRSGLLRRLAAALRRSGSAASWATTHQTRP